LLIYKSQIAFLLRNFNICLKWIQLKIFRFFLWNILRSIQNIFLNVIWWLFLYLDLFIQFLFFQVLFFNFIIQFLNVRLLNNDRFRNSFDLLFFLWLDFRIFWIVIRWLLRWLWTWWFRRRRFIWALWARTATAFWSAFFIFIWYFLLLNFNFKYLWLLGQFIFFV